ncbi:MAG: HD domain-containing protein [Candidatus Paceibacterota bacterium]|jgi:uncharacterized protein
MEEKYQKIKKIAEENLKECDAGHDINHVLRVYDLCLKLIQGLKGVDLEILQLAALLHDIGGPKELRDKTGKVCHARESAKMAQKILKNLKYSQGKIDKVIHCILAHRHRTGVKPETKEAKILFDADKLDALGALGIARAYIWIGKNNAKIYSNMPLKSYIRKNVVGGKLNGRIKDKSKHNPFFEFELKLKRLPQSLYTIKAKKIARERLSYMTSFFERFKKEVAGKI